MYQIVHESWLTRLVDEFGDHALIGVMASVYESGIFKVALTFFVSLAFVSLGVGLHRRQLSQKAVFAALAFLLLFPVSGRPSAYVIIHTLGSAVRFAFESGVNRVVSDSAVHSQRSNMPPGLVLEMVIAAASAKIEDPVTRALIHGFVVNCLPNALNKNGEHAVFEDLFRYETKHVKDPVTGKSSTTYVDLVLNTKSLENDNSYSLFRPGKSCFQGLKDMRGAFKESQPKDPVLLDRVLRTTGKNASGQKPSEKEETTEKWFKNWRASGSKFQDLAHNLATARAASYEKSKIISTVANSWGTNWYERSSTDASLRELMSGYGSLSSIGYHLSDAKSLISNSTKSRWSFSLGAAIKDLKERIELLPYNLAAVRLLLKFLLPFVLLTLFLQTFRFVTIWAGAWVTALIVPSVISASRSVGNSILLSKLGIENLANADGYKALAHGVDLSVAEHFIEDFTPLGYALINQELTIIKVMSGFMLVGGWLAGGGANGFVSWMSNSIHGSVAGAGASFATHAAGKKALKTLPAVAKWAGPIGAATVSAGSLAYGALRTVSQMRASSPSPGAPPATDLKPELPKRGKS